MALQMILGGSGSGKSTVLYEWVISQSMRHPEKNYIVIVPDQFTLQTQRELIRLHPRKGILNIDVLSFVRLAYRVFDETGTDYGAVLTETGKNLLLRRVAGQVRDQLRFLGGHLDREGYVSSVRSVLSEFAQYEISDEELEQMIAGCETRPLLKAKLEDILVIRRSYDTFRRDRYITGEELLGVFAGVAKESDYLRGSTLAFDGFTGFTPVQMSALRAMFPCAEEVKMAFTLDPAVPVAGRVEDHELFALSRRTIQSLYELARDTGVSISQPLILGRGRAGLSGKSAPEFDGSREKETVMDGQAGFTRKPALAHLEKYILRPGAVPAWQPGVQADTAQAERTAKPAAISLHLSHNPSAETEFAARTVLKLTREEGYRFQDIAIIAGNLPSYDYYLKQTFGQYQIPLFIDQKTRISLNPCLEFVRSAQEMAQDNLSYESVIRYLRTGFTGLSAHETDLLENYLLARGIRGRKAWEKEWTAPTVQVNTPEKLARINQLRVRFLDETGEFLEAFRASRGEVRAYADALIALTERAGLEDRLDQQARRMREEAEAAAASEERRAAGAGIWRRVPAPSAALATAMEYEQVYGKMTQVISEAGSLLGSETVTRAEFMKILDAGFEQARIGVIPTGLDQVYAGDLTRTRLGRIRVLIFVGLNDGWVPSAEERTGILSDRERAYLKQLGVRLAPDEREAGYQERFYEYLCLTKPSDRLILSWSACDSAGKAMRPSYLVRAVRKLFPTLSVKDEQFAADDPVSIASPQAGLAVLARMLRMDVENGYREGSARTRALLKLYRTFENGNDRNAAADTDDLPGSPAGEEELSASDSPNAVQKAPLTTDTADPTLTADRLVHAALLTAGQSLILPDTARMLYGDVIYGSVSQMETFAGCPFRYFGHYGLKLQEREQFEVSAADMGSIFHRALEKYANALSGGLPWSWFTIPVPEQLALADRCVEESCREYHYGIFGQSARNRYCVSRIAAITRRTAWALTAQVQAGAFVPAYFEQKFLTVSPGREISGTGDTRRREGTFPPDPARWPDFVRLRGVIDRIDLAKEEDRVYLKIIDYKSGHTAFDLQKVYDGQQLQLAVYLQQALQEESVKNRGKIVIPAGIFYEHLDDPVIASDAGSMAGTASAQPDSDTQEKILKELRPDGLANGEPDALSLLVKDPEKLNLYTRLKMKKDGSLYAGSQAADTARFHALTGYTTRKIVSYAQRILSGDTRVMPYTDGKTIACDYCVLRAVCGRDRHLPGTAALSGMKLDDQTIWDILMQMDEGLT